jgi:hypothetical protein
MRRRAELCVQSGGGHVEGNGPSEIEIQLKDDKET